MNRKQRRAMSKLQKKGSDKEKEMAQKVALFGKLPESCMTCNKPFDKGDREMVMEWNVVVRNDRESVNLYCPTCWDKARQLIEELNLMEKSKDED